MPVLKQHYNTPALKEAIVLDLGDLGAQAAKIRLAAEQRATQIINEAQSRATRQAEQLGKEAYDQGLANGHEAGLQQGLEEGRAQALADMQQQLQQLDSAWTDLAQQWEQQRVGLEREARQAVLEFALCAAEKLVHRVIEVDDSVVVDQAGQALSLVLSAHDARLRVHPVDRELLEAALPQLLAEAPGLDHVDLIEDDQITPGGCVVTFGQGRIDATVEKQLERLVDLILPAPELSEEDEPLSAEAVSAVAPPQNLTDTAATAGPSEPGEPPAAEAASAGESGAVNDAVPTEPPDQDTDASPIDPIA